MRETGKTCSRETNVTDFGSISLDEHFLVLAPTGRDAVLTRDLLERAGLKSLICGDVRELCMRASRQGAAALLIAEEVLMRPAISLLARMLERQDSWSDLPVLVFTGAASSQGPRTPLDHVIRPLGNVNLLDRPLKPITMISAAKSALRTRRRQYVAREALFEQQRAVRQRDQFLAMLGHELRNPLSAIVMAIEVMGHDESVERRILHRQATHLTRLVDDLLDVSRVTTGKAQLQCEDLDLTELIRSCLQSLDSSVRSQQLSLTFRAPSQCVWVHADPIRCEQIVANLVTNAAKYTPVGGSIAVSLSVDEKRAEAVLRVTDSGEGISADMLPHVFELFAQAEGTLDRAKGGMGIGLTLVRSLVELHRGSVEAASDGLGCGSTFSLRLPLLVAEQAKELESTPPPAPATATHPKCRHCEILLVEDNPDSREMLAMLLERAGHTVYMAEDGAEGISEAFSRKPQVLLVDIGLPGIDGYSVARTVRNELGSNVFMIALTGYGQPEDKERSLRAGFDVHLTKPVDVQALERLLRDFESRAGSDCYRSSAPYC